MKKLPIIALSAMLMTAPAFAEISANYSTNQTVGQFVTAGNNTAIQISKN